MDNNGRSYRDGWEVIPAWQQAAAWVAVIFVAVILASGGLALVWWVRS